MRILIIGKMFPPATGARALQLAKVALALNEMGCDIRVFAGIAANDEKPRWPFPVNYVILEDAIANPVCRSPLRRFIISLNNSFRRRGWWCRATSAALKIIPEFNPDIILSSSSPYDSHRVALTLHRKTGIPWIAYFSDPWPPLIMPVPYKELPNSRGRLKTFWEMRLVRKTMRKCAALVMGNSYALELMEKETGVAVVKKGFAIPHIGTERFDSCVATNKKLAHIGKLCECRYSPELLTAVKRVATEMPDRFKGLVLVGDVCEAFRKLIQQEDMEDLVECVGYLPAARAQEIASCSHALLVVEADMKVSPFLPSKFADYTMMARPIIAITPPVGTIRDYLEEYDGGWAVTHNAEQIADVIRKAFNEKTVRQSRSRFIAGSPLSSIFRDKNVARLYIDMFENVLRGMKINGEKR